MRDGNTQATLAKRIGVSGFEPTYEGWKQASNYALMEARPVLSLPMRDGNIGSALAGPAGLISFEPTYEGWKPC